MPTKNLSQTKKGPPDDGSRERKREWAARIWIGMSVGAWTRALWRHRFAVHPMQWHTAALMLILAPWHSVMRRLERLIYRRALRGIDFPEAPIFVIGHWRTGTTWLHELLTLDERHTFPDTYQCFEPNHFLLTERLFRRWKWLLPSQRPMDNMGVGFDRPQEDEFALAILGQPSPYLTIAFPNRRHHDEAYEDLRSLPAKARESWRQTFVDFLQRVSLHRPGRLVLKSPTHSFRIRTLLEIFPDARFVHIVRDPRVVFPSTVHLWKTLHTAQGLQTPHFRGLEERVFETFLRLYQKIEEDRSLVAPSRFFELRYEDLVDDPIGQLHALYEQLELGDFDRVRPKLEADVARRAGYRTNRYELDDALKAEVERRWGEVIRRYGYGETEEPRRLKPQRQAVPG